SDLKNLDALICNAEAEIELLPDVYGWAPSLNERRDDPLAPLLLKLAERHCWLPNDNELSGAQGAPAPANCYADLPLSKPCATIATSVRAPERWVRRRVRIALSWPVP